MRSSVLASMLASSMRALMPPAEDVMAAKAAWDVSPATRPLRPRRATCVAPPLLSSHLPDSNPKPPRPPVMAAVLLRPMLLSPAVPANDHSGQPLPVLMP